MRHGSLFSGIGGFDLAAEWMGWENIFHCEWNPFGRRVLHHYWPKAISYEDVTTIDFRCHRGSIDILTGGFPCQPYSSAGKRRGKEDERHLWPEMLRAIREIKPQWVVGENVRGLVNWNGGLVFDEVQLDLEAEGYEVQPFLLPAAGLNAPHRRNRIWFVAHSNGSNDRREPGEDESKSGEEWVQERHEVRQSIEPSEVRDASNPTSKRRGMLSNESTKKRPQGSNELSGEQCGLSSELSDATNSTSDGGREDNGQRESRFTHQKSQSNDWENFPTKPALCGGDDGLPRELDGITFPKWRNESIKAYGNAIVPQVALQIFKAINQYETKEV